MKKKYIYIALAAFAVLGSACSKNSAIEGPDGQSEYMISFGKIDVKADGEDPVPEDPVPHSNRNIRMTVYDYLTPAGGTESEYFNDQIKTASTSTAEAPLWEFVNASHAWKAGKHEFIAWVSTDEAGNTPTTLSYENKVLTVAAGTALPGEDNIDYRYASDEVVNWTSALKDKPVQLTVKHLSSALTYTFTNTTSDDSYEITGVTVKGIVTEAGATVTYGGEGGENVKITLNKETKDNFALSADSKTMVWPQEVAGATLEVKYNVNVTTTTVDEETGEESSEPVLTEKSAVIPVPEVTWEAGKVYNFKIEVVDKSIKLTLQVIPWTDWEGEVSYGTGDVVTANALEYTSGAAVTTGGSRRRNNYFAYADAPISGYFSVYAPSNGTWKIKVTGDTSLLKVTSAQATNTATLDDGTLEISGPIVDEDGNTGRVYFNITRESSATAENKIQLNFYVVTADGREISINSEVTRRNALTITGQYKGVAMTVTGGTMNTSGIYEFNAADTDISGSYSLFDPTGDKWVIRATGDTDKLIVSSGDQTIAGEVTEITGPIGTNPIQFTVKRGATAGNDSKVTLDFFTLKEEEGKDPVYTKVNHIVTKAGSMVITGAIKE
ncbi:MAG: hypothetical protein IJ202_00920 [Bacteroidales bacterium]|nr:hypothetical protein [Bacteroidales bacterium]